MTAEANSLAARNYNVVVRPSPAVYNCPSFHVSQTSWFLAQLAVPQPVGVDIPKMNNNYFGCMGGGIPTITNNSSNADACLNGNQVGGLGVTQYKNGILTVNGKVKAETVADGTSNTILVGESIYQILEPVRTWGDGYRTQSATNCIPSNLAGTSEAINGGRAYYLANQITSPPTAQNLHNIIRTRFFGSSHPGGASFGMGDGSVQFLADTINVDLFRYLGSKDDGRVLAAF